MNIIDQIYKTNVIITLIHRAGIPGLVELLVSFICYRRLYLLCCLVAATACDQHVRDGDNLQVAEWVVLVDLLVMLGNKELQ